MKKEINREKAVKLITEVICEKMKNGELSNDFYEWKELDYDIPEEFEKAQEIQERFQYYDKVAFDLECGNEITDEQIDTFYLNLKGRRESEIEENIETIEDEISFLGDEIFWMGRSMKNESADEMHSVWCKKEIAKLESKIKNYEKTIDLLEKYKGTL